MGSNMRKISRRSVLKLAAGAATAGIAAGIGCPYILKKRPKKNVVFIISDAFRGDKIGNFTPYLSKLKSEGTSFSNAIAPSSWTPISMPAILYDTSPFLIEYSDGHLWEAKGEHLAELAADNGYYTAMINGNEVIDIPSVRKGFVDFINTRKIRKRKNELPYLSNYRSSSTMNTLAEPIMERLETSKSFFLEMHYMDTHGPYYSPSSVLKEFGEEYNPELFPVRVNKYIELNEDMPPVKIFSVIYEKEPESVPIQQAINSLRNYYDSAVISTDISIRQLMTALDSKELLEDALVVFSSDHGEKLADDSESRIQTFGHAQGLTKKSYILLY